MGATRSKGKPIERVILQISVQFNSSKAVPQSIKLLLSRYCGTCVLTKTGGILWCSLTSPVFPGESYADTKTEERMFDAFRR